MTHPLVHSGVIHLRIGKSGITPGVVNEVKSFLQAHDAMVIKFLQSFCEGNDRKTAAQTLAEQTKSHVASLVGGTLVLTRKR